jgi:hypothetical protein
MTLRFAAARLNERAIQVDEHKTKHELQYLYAMRYWAMSAPLQQPASGPSRIGEHFPFRDSIRPAQEKALAVNEHARDNDTKFVLLELPTGTEKCAVAIAAVS